MRILSVDTATSYIRRQPGADSAMLFSRSGGQPRGAKGRVQVGYAVAILPVSLLSGCSSLPGSMNPLSWWHDLEGGKIAEERPPPPGADHPYPNLASVPPKPPAPDRAALANIASGLVADRTNAQHVAAAAPLADPSSASASPELFGKGSVPPPAPPPPPGSQQASATMPAVEAPAAPATPSPPGQANQPPSRREMAPPPATAPVGNVQSTPLAPPGATAQTPATVAAASPPLPAAPPPPPSLPGLASRPPAAAAAPSQVAATPSPAPPATAANTVSVTFVNGSAELPSFAADTLKQLAARRGNGVIAVTGYGDAASDDPDAQSAALALGLSRAKAMAAALTQTGVPASAVQVDAQAIGRGGSARLIQ
jgi:outer membrane protein OmpA-like peptidoglycan-associated protein